MVDDPPYLSVGTAVSAKYKGAFCEAKVSKVEHTVKCKVTYKMGLGSSTILDTDIKGALRVGQLVQAKHPDRKETIEATITKIQDCSMYTVVFDDGDITTLRRSALCLKSGRHFNESETLDQLPLTHPEHFGNPVVGSRRGRRNRQLKDESSEEEVEEEAEPEDLEGYSQDIGRVVTVEGEKKRGKDGWFPGLVVVPSAQPTVRINIKDEFLVRSFRDGRYYTVPKKEVQEFDREASGFTDSGLADAVRRAVEFLDEDKLPPHWERGALFNIAGQAGSDSDGDLSDSSDDEQSEEKDRFVAQLYKFMDDAGTPLNRTPTVAGRDVDLHRLFRAVQKLGGHNRATNQNKWRAVAGRMRLPATQNVANQIRSVYKKCLGSYETFNRTLGVTMLNHTRPSKKAANRGRSLIRDKDRSTPIQSPRPDKDDEEDKERDGEGGERPKRRPEGEEAARGDANSDAGETAAPGAGAARPKRNEGKSRKAGGAQKGKAQTEKKKAEAEKADEPPKEEEKGQQTRSKSQYIPKLQREAPPKKTEPKPSKEPPVAKTPKIVKKPAAAITAATTSAVPAAATAPAAPAPEDEKKRGRKRILADEKSDNEANTPTAANVGDKLKVYYGPMNESKVTYEAKVIEVDKDSTGPICLVHYTGWNTRYDEWIPATRIAENLSASTKAKRVKQNAASASSSKPAPNKVATGKRGRGASISGKASDGPRSTTPSSVTSGSSRTKSPATPATRSLRLMRQDSARKARRTSSAAQTDNSAQSDSNSESSESEAELSRTRSGTKAEEPEVRTYKRKAPAKRPASPKKESEDTEKEEEEKPTLRRTRKIKKSPEKSESDEDNGGHPRGRDFDLNQIRSELKGFTKALKVPMENVEKDSVTSSDDSTNPASVEKPDEKEEIEEKEPSVEKSTSSEDIYEFKEPEPFEFESRKLVEDKNSKKRLPRIFDELEKSPKKKTMRSPGKSKSPSPVPEKKREGFRRTPLRKQDDSEDEGADKGEDPFDKLVESPSFNLGKPTTLKECIAAAVASTVPVASLEMMPEPKPAPEEPPLTLFSITPPSPKPPEPSLELSDTDSRSQTFPPADSIFPTTFSRSSPDRSTTNDMEFSSGRTDEGKTTNSDDDDTMIREQIQRAIDQSSSTDDDSDGGSGGFAAAEAKPLASLLGIAPTPPATVEPPPPTPKEDAEPPPSPPPIEDEPAVDKDDKPPQSTIDPALQETDSSLLESIVSQPPPMLVSRSLDETVKELKIADIGVKSGPKIADTLLQKFKSLSDRTRVARFSPRVPRSPKTEGGTESAQKSEVREVAKGDEVEKEAAEKKKEEEKEEQCDKVEEEVEPKQPEEKPEPPTTAAPEPPATTQPDTKKRRRVLSKQFVEESDTDSSDSEQLVIAKSDDDSRTAAKADVGTGENAATISSATDDDSRSRMDVEGDEFKFEVRIDETAKVVVDEVASKEKVVTKEKLVMEEEVKCEEIVEAEKEEEEDPTLHSMLLCEEEIPRSPAPPGEPASPPPDLKPSKTINEMPFASAPPGSSAMLLEAKKAQATILSAAEQVEEKPERAPSPPTTPESTVSNFSPRGDNGGASPNAATNDSSKSNGSESDYPLQRRNSTVKVSPYSEEDTRMVAEPPPPAKKQREEVAAVAGCRKRRKSHRCSEDGAPSKRGRRPPGKPRRDSDTDDDSGSESGGGACGDRSDRSPRPSKYNFYVEFDPSLDSTQRIAILQQKISDLRRAYADVKTELAAVERRRKKIRRREREALKAAKQEVACA